ncbi:MAG: glycosyltransferase [Lachnospiraceae bacterium]|nr:glycosyltransferase [Lachnospiraceae bacterium]
MVELIYDVHASESGALAILDDLYLKIKTNAETDKKYVFIVSTPDYESAEKIVVERYPWVKKSWIHRLYFDYITTRKILRKYRPDRVYSLQNKGIPFFHGEQDVYLHLPFVLCDYRFDLKKDGKRLWLYQNVLSRSIFKSLRQVNRVIVQTQWMKDALIQKAGVKEENIFVQPPDISMNVIGTFADTPSNRKRYFYPATAFHYKNHLTLFKAIEYASRHGLADYEVILTIKKDENSYTREVAKYVEEHGLNALFMGQVSREKVFELYANSILLFPSFVESFGLPLLEARLTNTYVVASDCPFCREILDGYAKARFFDPLNYTDMAEKILGISLEGE